MATRPAEVTCENCGAAVQVAARGRVPKLCPACRAPKPTGEVVSSNEVDDGWPQQVAPMAWLDQRGNRYTDLGEAQAGVRECRGQ